MSKKMTTAVPMQLLAMPEVAEYLCVSEHVARRWAQERRFPVIKLGGKARSRVRVRLSDLEAFVAANTSPARQASDVDL